MGGRGNLNTLRKLFNWNSTWYNKNSYKQLLFRDLVIDVYLTSLFYKLRIASSYFFIKNSFFSIYIIECDLYLAQRQKLLSIFFNYKEFAILMRLFYTFLKKNNLFKVKKRNASKPNQGGVSHTKTSFFGLSWYYNATLLNLLCTYYFFTYNIRNVLITDAIHEDLDKTTRHSLSLLSKKSITGDLYATYFTALSQHDIASPSNNTTFEHKLLPETFYFIKYSYKVLFDFFFLEKYSSNVRNSNLQFIFSLLSVKENHFYKTVSYTRNLKKTISIIRTFKNEVFYRYHIMFHTISKLSRLLSKKTCTYLITVLKQLYSKMQLLANLIVTAFCLQKKKTIRCLTTSKYTSVLLSFVYNCQMSDTVIFHEKIFSIYYTSLFNWLSNKIEHTLISYTGSNYLFRPTLYLNYKPFITNSKILGEYVSLSLSGGDTVNNVFKSIQQWIEGQHLFLEYRGVTEFKNRVLNSSYIPLKGVRIICKGPTSIARRKRKVTFHTWVSNNNITGKMPAQSLSVQVDFYQTFAVMPQASVGIKVWTLFEFIENC